MQKCAPLPPKPRCGLGSRRMLNSNGRLEDVLVEVGRTVEQADALPLADGDPADLGVRRRGSLEAVHRRGPADDLVDRGVGPLPLEQLPLVGVLEERVHAVRHRVARGLVARHGQQDDEERELDIADGLAVDVGLRSGG